jgi:3'-phosphoadenosine 5'-phosphosulfate sulfotransferase (PAPS reductase)/FAD synthetase
MKKNPLKGYEKTSGRCGIIGVMADESTTRKQEFLNYGCNAFGLKHPLSKPLSFWNESDIWEYIKQNNISYSKIYDMGEKRTGCMFCMFGVHLEKGTNRFQRMAISHPKQYDYCINKLGCGKVLDFIGVKYTPDDLLL